MTTTEPRLTLGTAAVERHVSIYQALTAKGFPSATVFAESQPNASLPELAAQLQLIDPMITWVLLERTLVDEAETSDTLERCARSLLARDLRSELPLGWSGESTKNEDASVRAGVFHALTIALPESCALAIQRVWRAMEVMTPMGWLPTGADDPILVATFFAYWVGPSTASTGTDE